MVRILTNDDVEQSLGMAELIEVLETSYVELDEGVALSRPRTDVHAPAATDGEYYRFKTMGGLLPAHGVYALRINSDVIRWVERNGDVRQEKLPRGEGERYVGFVVLFDADSGTPLLVFPDGFVQKLRVGATSAIAAKHLAGDASEIGVLGAGWQAQGQVSALTTAFDVDSVTVYSPTPESRAAFVEWIEIEQGVPATEATDPQAAFEADVVHTATNSRSPVYDVEWIDPGTHIGAINELEIDPRTLEYCDTTVVHSKVSKERDYWSSDVDTEDIPYLESTEPDYAAYPDLGALVNGSIPGRQSDDETTFFFNHIGLGTQFAAAGALLYERAEAAELGYELPTELLTQALVP